MHARNVGMLVVVDKDQRPLGLVTDSDLVVRVMAAGSNPDQTLISEVMTRVPHSVNEETPIEEALGIMRCGPYRRLPVVDRDGCQVGILSLDDVLDLLSEEFSKIGQLVQKESPESLAAT
jgi:CBS domain-containing protein